MARGKYTEHDVLLMICDISGYTQFMVSNAESRSHGYAVVTELMQALMRQVRKPASIAKLEGDAAFLYLPWPPGGGDEATASRSALEMTDRMFRSFDDKQRELSQSNICPCGACVNIERLALKVVIHRGKAAIHPIGRFSELSGIDVILAHRLLKNSLGLDRYVLLTEQAERCLSPRAESSIRRCVEEYAELGSVQVMAAAPPLSLQRAENEDSGRRFDTFGFKTLHILKRILVSRLMRMRLLRPGPFGNIPEG